MERFFSVSALLFAGLSSLCAEASSVAVRETELQPMNLQMEVCQFCFRECPVSCFAGTCGLNLASGINRFQDTSHCWTCDQSASTMNGGSMEYCTPQQSGATIGMTRVNVDGTPAAAAAPMGGDILGNTYGKRASEKIADAVKSLEAAAASAGIAGGNPSGLDGAIAAHEANATAIGAGANMTETGAHGLSTPATPAAVAEENMKAMNPMQDAAVADNHRLAMQIRAAEALRSSQMAHAAWKMALNAYNWHLSQLRAQQITLDQSEEVVERMEKAANAARTSYASAQAQVSQATAAAMLSGDGAAGAEVAAAARQERETTYRAAQRRLLIAASEAKKASDLAGTIQLKNVPVAGGAWVEIKTKDSYPGCAMPMKAPDITHCKAKALELGFAGFTYFTGECCQGTCCFKDQTPAELIEGVVSDCGKTLWVFNPAGLLTTEQQAQVAPSADCPRCDWAAANMMVNMDCATVLWDEADISVAEAKVKCENDVECLGIVWHNKMAENVNFISKGHFQGCGGAMGANPKPQWDIITKPGTCQTAAASASASLLSRRANVTMRGPLRGLPAALSRPEVQAVQPEMMPEVAPQLAAPPPQDAAALAAAAEQQDAAVTDEAVSVAPVVVPNMGPGSFTAAAAQAPPADAGADPAMVALPALPADPNADPSMMAPAAAYGGVPLPGAAGFAALPAVPGVPPPTMAGVPPMLGVPGADAAALPQVPPMAGLPGADAAALPQVPPMPAAMAQMPALPPLPAGLPVMPEGAVAGLPPMPDGATALLEVPGRSARLRRGQPLQGQLRHSD